MSGAAHLQEKIDFVVLGERLLLVTQLPRSWKLGAERRDQRAHARTVAQTFSDRHRLRVTAGSESEGGGWGSEWS